MTFIRFDSHPTFILKKHLLFIVISAMFVIKWNALSAWYDFAFRFKSHTSLIKTLLFSND